MQPGPFPQVTGPAASRMLAFLTPARASKSFPQRTAPLARPPSEGKQTEACDRPAGASRPANAVETGRGRDENWLGRGGERVPKDTFLTGSPAPRGGSPRKQTQCTKVQATRVSPGEVWWGGRLRCYRARLALLCLQLPPSDPPETGSSTAV